MLFRTFGFTKKLTKPWDETEFRIILKNAYDLFLLKENVLNTFW
jgi:hypothetical protein